MVWDEADAATDETSDRGFANLVMELDGAITQVEVGAGGGVAGVEAFFGCIEGEMIGKERFRDLSAVGMISYETILLGDVADFIILIFLATDGIAGSESDAFQGSILNGILTGGTCGAEDDSDLVGRGR